MGRNQYWAGRVYDLCVYYMTGSPEGSTESGIMEKPGIEPATPGLQGIALIHYTTGASQTLLVIWYHTRHSLNTKIIKNLHLTVQKGAGCCMYPCDVISSVA